MNPLILGLMYLVCFIPLGFVFKLCGYDPLRSKKTKASTYWLLRESDKIEDPMRYQF